MKLLLIEKDKDTRSNWVELFKLFKYDVMPIGHLKDLVYSKPNDYDIIVADTDSVGLDGLQLKQALNNDFTRLPIVFVSAENNSPVYSLDREESSAVAFLRKPFDNSLLLEYVNKAKKIKEVINNSRDSQTPIAKLLIKQPNMIDLEIALKRSYTLGRYRETDEVHADIKLSNPSASRKHAFLIRIYKGKDSYYKLIDFSSNGILINGRRMPQLARLNHQDEIIFYPESKAIYTEIEREAADLDVTLTSKDG